MKERFFYIDFIKVIACLSIILFHLNVHSFYANNSAPLLFGLRLLGINLGDIGVSLFIIASGFGLGLANKADFSIKRYLKKRFLAIYPSYWFSYLTVAIIFILLGKTIGENQAPVKFILTIIGLDGLFLYKFPSFYLVGEWYTGYMILTYLIFPFLFLYALKKPIFSVVCIFILIVVLHNNYQLIFDMWEPINPIMRLLEFFFGILYAQYFRKYLPIKIVGLIIAILFFLNIDRLFEIIPYHFLMIGFGMLIFISIDAILSLIIIPSTLSLIFSNLSKYTFLAFLVHHQILVFFFEKIPSLPMDSNWIKFCVYCTVSILSFGYAMTVYPTVMSITKLIDKRLFKC